MVHCGCLSFIISAICCKCARLPESVVVIVISIPLSRFFTSLLIFSSAIIHIQNPFPSHIHLGHLHNIIIGSLAALSCIALISSAVVQVTVIFTQLSSLVLLTCIFASLIGATSLLKSAVICKNASAHESVVVKVISAPEAVLTTFFVILSANGGFCVSNDHLPNLSHHHLSNHFQNPNQGNEELFQFPAYAAAQIASSHPTTIHEAM